MEKNTKIRPFLKWAGGKFRLLDRILPWLPEGNCLIEPYAGSGAVFLNTNYDRYILNDINPDLIHTYQYVKKKPAEFITQARDFFHPKYNQEKMYYALRDQFNQTTDLTERAILFLYLNRHGYNGLCRYNQKGGFNVPFGRYKNPYFPEKEIYAFAQKAKKARFVCQDFKNVMQKAKTGNIIYCDPPYVPLSDTASFTQYAQTGFTETEQTTLAALAEDLQKRNIITVISNHDTQFTRKLYRKANIKAFQQKRYISCKTNERNHAKELVACFNVD